MEKKYPTTQEISIKSSSATTMTSETVIAPSLSTAQNDGTFTYDKVKSTAKERKHLNLKTHWMQTRSNPKYGTTIRCQN